MGVPLQVSNEVSLLGGVARSRADVLSTHPMGTPFDRLHRKYAGFVSGGDCEIPSHQKRPCMGCCAYGHYCTYSGYMDKMLDILDGSDSRRLFTWKLRDPKRSKLSLPQFKFAHFGYHVGEDMVVAGNKLMRNVVGSPPTCLHVSLNHRFGSSPGTNRSLPPEVLSDWDYASTVSFECSKSLVEVPYDLAAVVLCDNSHWVAMVIDASGGTWSYDSTLPALSPGTLVYRGNSRITPATVVNVFGFGYSPRVVVYTVRPVYRGTSMRNEDETDTDDDYVDFVIDGEARVPSDFDASTSVLASSPVPSKLTMPTARVEKVIVTDLSMSDTETSDSMPTRCGRPPFRLPNAGNIISPANIPVGSNLILVRDEIGYLLPDDPGVLTVQHKTIRSCVSSITSLPHFRVLVHLVNGDSFSAGAGDDPTTSDLLCYKQCGSHELRPASSWCWGLPCVVPALPGGIIENWDMLMAHPHYVFQRGDPVQYVAQSHSAHYGHDKPFAHFGTIESIHEMDTKNVKVRMVGGDFLCIGSDFEATFVLAKGDLGKPFSTTHAKAEYYGWRITPPSVRDAIRRENALCKSKELIFLEDDLVKETTQYGMGGFVRRTSVRVRDKSSTVMSPPIPQKVDSPASTRYLYSNNHTSKIWSWGSAADKESRILRPAVGMEVHDVDAYVPTAVLALTCGLPVWQLLPFSDLVLSMKCDLVPSLSATPEPHERHLHRPEPHDRSVDTTIPIPQSAKRKLVAVAVVTPRSATKVPTLADPRLHADVPETQEFVRDNQEAEVFLPSHSQLGLFSPAMDTDTTDVEMSICSPCVLQSPNAVYSQSSDSTAVESVYSYNVPTLGTPGPAYLPAGTTSTGVYDGWHQPHFVDLTAELKHLKPNMQWTNASTYYHNEFIPALQVMKYKIRSVPGMEFFYQQRRYCVLPRTWKQEKQPFPPNHPNSYTKMKHFGMKFRCDHFRRSGCPVEMTIKREYNRDMSRDLFSVTMSKGDHIMGCNHQRSKNNNVRGDYPALHPAVDMYLRQIVESTKSCRTAQHLADIEVGLKQYMLSVTALHCTWPHADRSYVFGSDCTLVVNKKCAHWLNYENLAQLPTFRQAQCMPQSEIVPESTDNGSGGVRTTVRVHATLHHMLLQDGHSINGNHAFEAFQVTQMKAKLAYYNRTIRDENVISDSTTQDSGVGPVHANFKEQNLFHRWTKMVSTDPKVHKNLRLFEWNQIGLLYRKRTPAQVKAAKASVSDREDGDFPEQSDPCTLQYEYVSVYASLFSLICGVKAWACRKISGKVQISADNMYNCLKGVPNMYWLNVGVMDAKNICFPTVNALQLGRKAPRNEVPCLET